MTETFTIVCTGRGTHKRYTFNDVTIDDDRLDVAALRKQNAPEFTGMTDDEGTRVESFIVVRAHDPRHGNGWRWKCPLCPVDERFTTDGSLRAWLASVTRRVADISLRA